MAMLAQGSYINLPLLTQLTTLESSNCYIKFPQVYASDNDISSHSFHMPVLKNT